MLLDILLDAAADDQLLLQTRLAKLPAVVPLLMSPVLVLVI
jgi:hypothetical protein